MTKPGENIALFDLDGSLADYEGAMSKDLNLIRGPDEPLYPVFMNDKPEYLKRRSALIRKTPGWWENLPVIQTGLYVLLEAPNLGYEAHVLTKGPDSADNAWTEKVRWCKKNLPESVKVTITQDKGLVYGKILFDDFPEYVSRWLEWRPRGLVIMPADSNNESFSHPNVLRYDGSSFHHRMRVIAALKMAFERKPGESLPDMRTF